MPLKTRNFFLKKKRKDHQTPGNRGEILNKGKTYKVTQKKWKRDKNGKLTFRLN